MSQWLKLHVPRAPDDWGRFPSVMGHSDLTELIDPAATVAESAFLIAGAENAAEVASDVSFVASLVGAVKMQWTSLGEGYAAAKEEITFQETAKGYGIGACLGADNVGPRRGADLCGHRYLARNRGLPGGAQAAAEGYKKGLLTGYAEGRSLSRGQRQVLWKDLARHACTLPGWNDFEGQNSKQWSDGQWSRWYEFMGGVFAKFHIEGAA
jgi:hypothetical protein